MIKKQNSLRVSRHIKKTIDKGILYRGQFFQARANQRQFGEQTTRLAVITSKKNFALAVSRNKARRRAKAAFGKYLPDLSRWDLVVFPHKQMLKADFAKIEDETKKCLDFLQSKQSGFIRKP